MVIDGFKHYSHIGNIPDTWEVYSAQDVCSKITDGTHDTPKPKETGIPYIKSVHIKNGSIDFDNCLFLDKKDHNIIFKRCNPEKGDLLIVNIGAGNIGVCAYVNVDYEFSMKNIALVKPDARLLNGRYLYYFYISKQKRIVHTIKVGGAQPFLSLKDIKKLKLVIPPLPEQNKIANILTTWDKAIETVEQLIENSRAQKKALMQQLLSNDSQFNKHKKNWTDYQLGSVCTFLRGKALSKDKLTDKGRFKCILYGELYTIYEDIIHSVVSSTDHDEGLISCHGDVLIPSSTTTLGIDLANAVSLKEGGVRLGGDIIVLRTDDSVVDSDFLAYLLTHHKKHDIARLTQGITIIHLYGRDLKSLKVRLPSVQEQQKISSALNNCDKQRLSLESELAELQTEKSALMQQLLTGKRRVKV